MNTTTVHNAREAERWIDNARIGDRCIYHRGYLPRDRAAREKVTDPVTQEPVLKVVFDPQRGCKTTVQRTRRTREARVLHELADHVLSFADTGRCTLVQSRHGEHDYSYYCVRIW